MRHPAANDASTHRPGGPIRRALAHLHAAQQSLRFRLTLGVTLALGLILFTFILVHYVGHRQRTLAEAKDDLAGVGQIIEGSLAHAMLTRDLSELQQIMDDVATHGNVRSIELLNTQGQVRFASGGRQVGGQLDLQDASCQSCHREGETAQSHSVIFTTPQGEQILRNCSPIRNRPECYTCHDPQEPVMGAILTEFSLDETNAHLRAELWENVVGGLAVLVVTALTINWLLHGLVLAKLDQMMRAIRRFGSGDRSQRVPVADGDEMARLATTFNQMADGLQAKEEETERLYRELQQKEAARAELLRQVICAQEEERRRIARELHDDLAQTLTGLSLGLETALQGLPEATAAREPLLRARDLTTATLGQAHRWIQDLRPLMLDDLGLVPAIRWYAQTRLEPAGVQVHVEADAPSGRLPAELETALFRIVQEAINNVAKHAHAQRVEIRLQLAGGCAVAEIDDDGVGFDPQAYLAAGTSMRGIGLLGMRERVDLVSGRLAIESQPGSGTHIRIEVPWTAQQRSEC